MTPLEVAGKTELPPYHAVVSFGVGIPSEAQSVIMLAMEKRLRDMGIQAEVFKNTMQDDSRLRRSMTTEQRERL